MDFTGNVIKITEPQRDSGIVIDAELNLFSKNPVQNKVVTEIINKLKNQVENIVENNDLALVNDVEVIVNEKMSLYSIPEDQIQKALEKYLKEYPISDNKNGTGISSIKKTSTSGLVDTYTIYFTNGDTTYFTITNGADGYSPAATVKKTENKTTVTITDKNGTTTAEILDGQGSDSSSGTAENTVYNNDNFKYDNVQDALDALFNKVYYITPTCLLLADKKGGVFEMGTVISAPIVFTWTTNKDIISQSLTGCILIDEKIRTATYDTDITTDKTFVLSVSDGEKSATSTISYKFMNNVFWGSASTQETYNSTFINDLANQRLTTTLKGTYTMDIKNDEYGFFAVPSNLSIASVWIGGFEVTLEDVCIVSYTNSQGYTRDYKLYKTKQSSLGTITAEIK